MTDFKSLINEVSEHLAPKAKTSNAEDSVLRGIIRQSSFFYRIRKENLSPYHEHGSTIKVAAVTMNHECRFDYGNCWLKVCEKDGRELVGQGEIDIRAYENAYLEMLELAISNGADIVCFAEFAQPPRVAEGSNDDPHLQAEFEQRLWKIIQEKDVLLIGGSHHCANTHYNLCNVVYADPAGTTAKQTSHAKRRRAVTLGETVKTPNNPFMRVYGTRFGNIAILICFDALDPAAAFAMANENSQLQEHERIRFVFVPTFNMNIEVEKACKRLSYIANVVVCYTNWNTLVGNATALFVSGERFEDLEPNGSDIPIEKPTEASNEHGKCIVWPASVDILRRTYLDREIGYSDSFRAIRAAGRQHDPMKFRP